MMTSCCATKISHALLVAVVVVTVSAFLSPAVESLEAPSEPKVGQARARAAFGSQGIVVPKRSAIISGLNQQFRLKSRSHPQQQQQQQPPSTQQMPAQLPLLNVTISLQQPPPEEPTSTSTSAPSKSLFPMSWLGPLAPAKRQQQQQQQQDKQPQQQQQQQQQLQTQQNLYMDRYQQQLLAANPSLLNPPAGSNLSLALLTRSDASLAGLDSFGAPGQLPYGLSLQGLNGSFSRQPPQLQLLQQQQQASYNPSEANPNGQQQQQQYRGYSLIELEIKSEADRRFIQDLYGNLTAAINEQAQNPNSITVSPYVDVDFWSYRYALNDRIDIMVSPKSRVFILNQLAKAKIRHRIKIDDIQARLDQQQQQLASNSSNGSTQMIPGQQQQQAVSGSNHSNGHLAMGKSADSPLSGRQVGAATTTGHHSHHQHHQQASERRADLPLMNARQAPEVGQAQANSQSPMNDSVFFENYQRMADITQYIESIVERNRDIARVKVIGRSSQGRYLRVLRLGYEQTDNEGHSDFSGAWRTDSGEAGRQPAAIDNAAHILDTFFNRQSATKKLGSIWLDGGTHAREWISPATSLYIAHRLADNHAKCMSFFEGMRQIVAVGAAALLEQQQQQQQQQKAARQARRYVEPQPAVLPAPIPSPTHLDPNLIPSINEINTSLLGKPVEPIRARTELEKSMELLAKSPQVLANDYKCNLDLDQLLRRYTFYIMPVLNPDGYEYSHTHNRLWRKTRSTSSHPIYRHFCLGADPNRNYDARHGSTGSSTHPCSQTYAGTVPFTEPETRHQSNFVYANRLSLKMFISFHSYSQMILLPYSHSKTLAPDHKDLESVGQAAVKAIERTHGTVYRVGPSASILYTASGTASDWAYEKAGIKYSYTIELRDQGTYGFLLPKQQIVPTGEETFNGLLAMIDQMEKNDNLLTSKSDAKSAAGQTNRLATNSSSSSSSQHQHLQPMDYNHVPDPEQLKTQFGGPSHIGPIRQPLENILDGSDSWAAADYGPSGVRDRRPVPVMAEKREPAGSKLTDFEPSGPLADEHVGSDTEPDAGYAFEGEGELMEPTNDNIVEAAKLSNELRVLGRRDHSRRISQATGLTSTGRNYINSPLLTSRMTTSAPKRESSEDLNSSPMVN